MNDEKERIEVLLSELPVESALILKEILQAEKEILHLKTFQGTTIISDIVNIVKERIKE